MSYNCDQQEVTSSSGSTDQQDPGKQNKQQEPQKEENVQGESAVANGHEDDADSTLKEMDFEEAKKGLKRQHVTDSDSDSKQNTSTRCQRLYPQPNITTRNKDGKSASKSDGMSSKAESKSPKT